MRAHTRYVPFDTFEYEEPKKNAAKIYLVERPEIKSNSEFIQEKCEIKKLKKRPKQNLNLNLDGTGFIYHFIINYKLSYRHFGPPSHNQ